jgi:hypothetical protein
MFKYMLTRRESRSGGYGSIEILGTFGEIANVNDFLRSSPDYPDYVKFISCRQIIETTIKGVPTRLELDSVPFNPIDKIGELTQALEEEETILDLQCATNEAGDPLTSQDKELVTVQIKYIGKAKIFLQFSICGISLLEDGTWEYVDTRYGSDYAAQAEYDAEIRQAEEDED